MEILTLVATIIIKLLTGFLVIILGFGIMLVWAITLISIEEYLKDIIPSFFRKTLLVFILSLILSPFFLVLWIIVLLGFAVFFASFCLVVWINYKLNYRLYKVDVTHNNFN